MGIFARLKASFQGKEDADRYLKGLDKSKRSERSCQTETEDI